ncbi:MAG: class B sortase [Oscillospiraceae bacterium]|nr:class B sortase [Oscillospiraceae bacterium]
MKYKIKNSNKTQKSMNPGVKNPRRLMSDFNAAGLFKKREPEIIDEGKAFYNSLAALTENDIVLNETAVNIKKPAVDVVRYAALFILISAMLCSGYFLIQKLYAYINDAREYQALRELFYADSDSGLSLAGEILTRTKTNAPLQDILSLQRQTGERVIEAEVSEIISVDADRNKGSSQRMTDINPDYYGWITVSNTRIDYPVVQTSNDSYYLNHSFDRKPNQSGAIFTDSRNSRDIWKNLNTIVYGHNMLDGSMFQPILSFGSRRDEFNNGIIELTDPNGYVYRYEVFSAREADETSGYIQTVFRSDEEWVEFLYKMQELSNFNKNLNFNADSRMVTLSTCINDLTRGHMRFVVQGVLIDW